MGKYMKKVGHADAAMYFYVDSGKDFALKADADLVAEEPYYAHTNKKGCSGLLVFLCVYRIGSKW